MGDSGDTEFAHDPRDRLIPPTGKPVDSRTPRVIDMLASGAEQELRALVAEGWNLTVASRDWANWMMGAVDVAAKQAFAVIVGNDE